MLIWRVPRSILTLLFVMLFLWIAGVFAVLSAQTPVRHYVGEIEEVKPGILLQAHVMVGSDGRAAIVIMTGPAGQEPIHGAASGPMTEWDVEDEASAFCFTADDVDGFAEESLIGTTSCFVWLPDEDVMWETGGVLWGPATNGPFAWCGEDHALNAKQGKENWSRS